MNTRKPKLFPLLLVLSGNVLYALTVRLFLLPANLISCGTTGIALVVNHLTGLPIAVFLLAFNLALLCLGWWVLGRRFALTTLFSSLFYPFALELLSHIPADFQITQDILLNTLFSGLGMGLALGMVIRGGASTGGMDIPPLILQKHFRIPVSSSLWAFDLCIMLAQLLFHPLEDLLYGILLLLVIASTLNKVLLLGTSKPEIKIISPPAPSIRAAILSKVDRGVTLLNGEGGYLHAPTQVILSIVSNHEMPKSERLARDMDPDCFLVISRVTEVRGRGFSLSKHYGSNAL